MNRKEMLAELNEHGEDAASDLHDGLGGWFGWTVTGNVLTVTWTPDIDVDRGIPAPPEKASWRLHVVETA